MTPTDRQSEPYAVPPRDEHDAGSRDRSPRTVPPGTPIPADTLRAYLLGRLPDAARDDLELLLLADGDAHAAALEAETDLLDDYAQGNLGGADRRDFESRVLARPGMAERLAAARGLARWAEDTPAAAGQPQPTRSRDGLAGWWRGLLTSPGLRPALAAALVLLLAAVGFLTWRTMDLGRQMAGLHRGHDELLQERDDLDRDRAVLTEELAALRRDLAGAEPSAAGGTASAQTDPAAGDSAEPAAGAALVAARERIAALEEALATERAVRPTPPVPQRVEVTHLLALATRGAGVPTLEVPAGPGRLTLQLDAGQDGEYYDAFQARLLGPGGVEVWSRTGLAADADGGTVDLVLPAQAVEPGRYEVLLDGLEAGEAELVGAYEVEIRRP